MSINRYLEETASKLIIKGNEKESIDVSLNTFKDRMRDYFSKNESVNLKEIKVFGSYQRDTNLPQSVDYGTDNSWIQLNEKWYYVRNGAFLKSCVV